MGGFRGLAEEGVLPGDSLRGGFRGEEKHVPTKHHRICLFAKRYLEKPRFHVHPSQAPTWRGSGGFNGLVRFQVGRPEPCSLQKLVRCFRAF